jgi:nitrilase
MVSGPRVEINLAEPGRLIARAAGAGARLAVLPENFACLGRDPRDKLEVAETDGEGPIQAFLSQQAERWDMWIVGGTLPMLGGDGSGKVYGACLLYDPTGRRAARYDKIHLFDVQVPEHDEAYAESATMLAGAEPVVADSDFGRLGLAVCYDVRFPELCRRMSDGGLDLLALPAAFTAATGAAHWDVLVRARAVENLCYVVAPGQGGRHEGGRETHGHSMIVDPWGRVLDCLPSGSGVALAEMDPGRTRTIREAFPALTHRRLRG